MTKPVCVIVGVGPGNGASFARKFRQQGYQVVILARNEAYLAELSRQLDGAPFYSCDVTKVTQVESVFQKILRQFGEVDTLIYNAGAGQFKNVEDSTVEEFERSWQINALGCFVACKQLLPAMIDAGRGNFVVIGATASLRGKRQSRPFCFRQSRSAQPRPIHGSSSGTQGHPCVLCDRGWSDRLTTYAEASGRKAG